MTGANHEPVAVMTTVFASPDQVAASLDRVDYLADRGLSTAIFLSVSLGRPLFLEGDPGVGKTEVASALAAALGARLVRLQCYEGLDTTQAVYDWDHARQLLHLRAREVAGHIDGVDALERELWTEEYLIRRPVLDALTGTEHDPVVLLIDEIDRADDYFEAVLLEVLATASVTIPELGTISASWPPMVVLTSNRTRDVHDAVKRRCIYHWLDHPDLEREVAIIERRAPGVPASLARRVAELGAEFRTLHLLKPPGVAEVIDWAVAATALGADGSADPMTDLDDSVGSILKYREDIERVRASGILARPTT